MRRVVITGLGVVAPNGIGKEAFWSACLDGQERRRADPQSSTPRPIPSRSPPRCPTSTSTPFVPPAHRKSLKIMGRAMRFGVAAAGLAVQDSGLDLEREDPERLGVVMGTGMVPIDLPEIAPLLAAACDEEGQLHLDRLGQGRRRSSRCGS